jgi:SAM-dependent methyltransferase
MNLSAGRERAVLIFTLRPSRCKARTAATAEALSLLRDLNAEALPGGPLSERGGLFWIDLPVESLASARALLPRLGYSYAVDLAAPESLLGEGFKGQAEAETVRWRGQPYRLFSLYREDSAAFREAAPDRREFLLESEGVVRTVRGYRGSSDPLCRRGLPTEDARMVVNLVSRPAGRLLDPFAGAGGIAISARESGCLPFSVDIDPILRYGLAHLGAQHCVADSRRLPFETASFDAIATEPPYDPGSNPVVAEALREMARVLKPGGRMAIFCAEAQADLLLQTALSLPLTGFLDTAVNRKGTACAALAWEKEGMRDEASVQRDFV